MLIMNAKYEKLKKILITLGTVFNIISGCCLFLIVALFLLSVPKIVIDVIIVITIIVFDIGLILYLSALAIRIFFLTENKVNLEKIAFEKLLSDYEKGQLPEDVWRVLEYYVKVKKHGHLQFFTGLEIYKLDETVNTLIKILPLEFSTNLDKAYQTFNSLNLTSNVKSLYVEDGKTDNFNEFDEFFKSNTQKYEVYIKYYVGIIDNDKN